MPNQDQYLFQNNDRFELVLKGINAGVFEWDLDKNTCWCSSQFYELLGYKRGEIELSVQTLLNHFISPNEKDKMAGKLHNFIKNPHPFIIEVQLLDKSGNYRWYKLAGQLKSENGKPNCLIGSLTDIEHRVKTAILNKRNEFLLEETGLMAKVGGWELDLNTQSVTWSKEVCLIHEMPTDFVPKLEEAINFYSPEYVPIIENAVNKALTEGTPFDLELKIITSSRKEIWVRAIGKTVYDHNQKKITGLRGVFQDINEQKEKELALQESLNLINEQNKRLFDFAHIVSHNLKSHATNLELTLSLLETETDATERAHFNDNIKKISHSISQTISHLNDIVVIQTSTNSIRKQVQFEEVFLGILSTFRAEIEHNQALVEFDFDDCPEMEYIPAYLESILLNLVSNAIKYRNPEKPLKIKVKTSEENGRAVLEVSDNGLGIDLNKNGQKLFGMYKTFHNNLNSRGIGLFITKNQIETLGGKIEVLSEVNKGSTFKITF